MKGLLLGAQFRVSVASKGEQLALIFLQDGQLVPVLPDWQSGKRPFYMLHCQPRFTPLRVKMFADFVEKHSERYRTRQQNDQFSPAQPLPVASDG